MSGRGERATPRETYQAQNIANLDAIGLTGDFLGERVREAWVRWAERQPNPKPHWLAPWAELGEADREADREIGRSIALMAILLYSASLEPLARSVPLSGASEATSEDTRRLDAIERQHLRIRPDGMDGWIVRRPGTLGGMRQGFIIEGAHRLRDAIDAASSPSPSSVPKE